MSEFNQSKYIQQYIKEHKKRFACDLNKEEFEELEKLLKEKGLKKVEFLRNSIENLKKERGDNMKNKRYKELIDKNKLRKEIEPEIKDLIFYSKNIVEEYELDDISSNSYEEIIKMSENEEITEDEYRDFIELFNNISYEIMIENNFEYVHDKKRDRNYFKKIEK